METKEEKLETVCRLYQEHSSKRGRPSRDAPEMADGSRRHEFSLRGLALAYGLSVSQVQRAIKKKRTTGYAVPSKHCTKFVAAGLSDDELIRAKCWIEEEKKMGCPPSYSRLRSYLQWVRHSDVGWTPHNTLVCDILRPEGSLKREREYDTDVLFDHRMNVIDFQMQNHSELSGPSVSIEASYTHKHGGN